MHTNRNLFGLLLTLAFEKGGRVEGTAGLKDSGPPSLESAPQGWPQLLRMHLPKFSKA